MSAKTTTYYFTAGSNKCVKIAGIASIATLRRRGAVKARVIQPDYVGQVMSLEGHDDASWRKAQYIRQPKPI